MKGSHFKEVRMQQTFSSFPIALTRSCVFLERKLVQFFAMNKRGAPALIVEWYKTCITLHVAYVVLVAPTYLVSSCNPFHAMLC